MGGIWQNITVLSTFSVFLDPIDLYEGGGEGEGIIIASIAEGLLQDCNSLTCTG